MSTAEAVERVLKKLATKKAQSILTVSGCHIDIVQASADPPRFQAREMRLPAHMFTSAYFGAFRPSQVLSLFASS